MQSQDTEFNNGPDNYFNHDIMIIWKAIKESRATSFLCEHYVRKFLINGQYYLLCYDCQINRDYQSRWR